MQAQTQTATGKPRRKRKAGPETPLDLLRSIVQVTHRFQTRLDQIAAFVEAAQSYPAFVSEALELYARLKYHDVNPRPRGKPLDSEKTKTEDAKRKFSLALANTFLTAKLMTTGVVAGLASGPQLRAEGGRFIAVAKKIPKGKVLNDIAATEDQRLALAAILEA